jgi:hypothetical protein
MSIFGATLVAIFLMHAKRHTSGSINKRAFHDILRQMNARFNLVEVTVTEQRVTESRYKWLAELKSECGRCFRPGQAVVQYSYVKSGKHFVVEMDERAGAVDGVRVHCEQASEDIADWLVAELCKVSPTLPIKVDKGKKSSPGAGGDS